MNVLEKSQNFRKNIEEFLRKKQIISAKIRRHKFWEKSKNPWEKTKNFWFKKISISKIFFFFTQKFLVFSSALMQALFHFTFPKTRELIIIIII